jgi:uncharacterized membrane protein
MTTIIQSKTGNDFALASVIRSAVIIVVAAALYYGAHIPLTACMFIAFFIGFLSHYMLPSVRQRHAFPVWVWKSFWAGGLTAGFVELLRRLDHYFSP